MIRRGLERVSRVSGTSERQCRPTCRVAEEGVGYVCAQDEGECSSRRRARIGYAEVVGPIGEFPVRRVAQPTLRCPQSERRRYFRQLPATKVVVRAEETRSQVVELPRCGNHPREAGGEQRDRVAARYAVTATALRAPERATKEDGPIIQPEPSDPDLPGARMESRLLGGVTGRTVETTTCTTARILAALRTGTWFHTCLHLFGEGDAVGVAVAWPSEAFDPCRLLDRQSVQPATQVRVVGGAGVLDGLFGRGHRLRRSAPPRSKEESCVRYSLARWCRRHRCCRA